MIEYSSNLMDNCLLVANSHVSTGVEMQHANFGWRIQKKRKSEKRERGIFLLSWNGNERRKDVLEGRTGSAYMLTCRVEDGALNENRDW